MLSPEKIFGNHFDEVKITSQRLANFCEDSLNRFKNIAIEGQFTATIAEMTAALDMLRDEMGTVDTSVNARKVKTFSVDEFMETFKDTMSSLEGVIAFRTGGVHSPAFMELYPNGVQEYRNASKTTMANLMTRVNTIVTKYGTELTAEVTDQLADFYTDWHTLRDQQEQHKSKVSDGRAGRTIARDKVELAMHNAMCTIMMKYPFDVEQCCRFFDFSMLFGVKHHHEEEEPVAANTAS